MLPLETAKSHLFRLFRLFLAFREIQAALPYPPDRSGQNGRNTRNTLVCGFSHPGTPLVPLDPATDPGLKAPTPGRLNQPVLADSGFQACILLKSSKRAVLAFSCFLEFISRKQRGGREFQACILLKRVPNELFSEPSFLVFSVFSRVFSRK